MKKIYFFIFIIIILINMPIYANDELVYIDKENIDPKYHRVTCSRITPNRYTTISVESAFAQGYRRCIICEPPLSSVEQTEQDKEYNERMQKFDEIMNRVTTTTVSSSSDDRKVYITKDSAKFHSAGCDEMKSVPSPTTVSDAKSRGYSPCRICNPYGLVGTLNKTNEDKNENPLIYFIIISIILLTSYLIINEKRYRKLKKS